MDGSAIKELRESFRAPQGMNELIATPGDWRLVDPATIAGPSAEALKVYTLGAVRDYIAANRDALAMDTAIAQVVSPQVVRLCGPIAGRARHRETFIEATAVALTDGFVGKFMPVDEFIIGLLTRFQPTDTRAALLKLFGTVTHEGVKTLADDGITQTVTAKTGIALKAETAIPNPITLTPYRTFREVQQPDSLFVLRVNGASTGALTAGLFEGDGGAWRIEAVQNVAAWLRREVPTAVAVIA